MNSPAHTRQFGTPQEQEDLRNRELQRLLEEQERINDYYAENQVEIPPEGEDQSDGFRMFTTEDGEEWAFNESQLRGEDPLPLEVQNMVLRGHDGTELNTSDGTYHFEGPPPDIEDEGILDLNGSVTPEYDYAESGPVIHNDYLIDAAPPKEPKEGHGTFDMGGRTYETTPQGWKQVDPDGSHSNPEVPEGGLRGTPRPRLLPKSKLFQPDPPPGLATGPGRYRR